jgi:hypothetical protein
MDIAREIESFLLLSGGWVPTRLICERFDIPERRLRQAEDRLFHLCQGKRLYPPQVPPNRTVAANQTPAPPPRDIRTPPRPALEPRAPQLHHWKTPRHDRTPLRANGFFMKQKEIPAATFHWNAPYRRGWLGGIVKSAAKSEAARRNGRKGGRPRKTEADSRTAIASRKPKLF